MSDQTKTVHRFEKNGTTEIRGTIGTFKGKTYASLREYYKTDEGDWLPTKKGVSVTLDKTGALLNAAKDLHAAAEAHQGEGSE
ncbi:hypothetical protein LCGC14_1938950 [marine sediment metagenome]|uniref:Transcriptional coactivator p15 (PC4) C-terminal domain-containing protein n=1 Tax=marine sediment metagenome TaxID=412755 RepID=A0A0F9II95_9ZZZZ